jgi:hypothetical protein
MINWGSFLMMHLSAFLRREGRIVFLPEDAQPAAAALERCTAAYSSAIGFETALGYSGKTPEVRSKLDAQPGDDLRFLREWNPFQQSYDERRDQATRRADSIIEDIGNRVRDEGHDGDIVICADSGLLTALLRKMIYDLLPGEYEHLEAVTNTSFVRLGTEDGHLTVDRLTLIDARIAA